MFTNFFTIYQHPKETKKGKCYKWYYYYYDQNGKKVQKACRGCNTREESENFIAKIPIPENYLKRSNLIKDIAKNMFLPGSDHMERRKQLGKSTYAGTVQESRRFINTIIKQWGDRELHTIQYETVMTFLFSITRSGKWKNKFIEVLNEIYSEAPWYKCRAKKLALDRFSIHTKKADPLYRDELINLCKRQFYR